jgi:SAM-dependent methyltransferase
MFALSDADLQLRILGCGDGPASFNAELTQRGGNIISIDPIYQFDTAQINSRIEETYAIVLEQLRQNQQDYLWETIPSVEKLGEIRMAAMKLFLQDYDSGKNDGRYIAGELPFLPFENAQFDLALSSHFLFLYSEHLSAEFHLQALQEMLRVATEVRVFPLVTLNGKTSPHLEFILEALKNQGFSTRIRQVAYQFQRGANQMLVISSEVKC